MTTPAGRNERERPFCAEMILVRANSGTGSNMVQIFFDPNETAHQCSTSTL